MTTQPGPDPAIVLLTNSAEHAPSAVWGHAFDAVTDEHLRGFAPSSTAHSFSAVGGPSSSTSLERRCLSVVASNFSDVAGVLTDIPWPLRARLLPHLLACDPDSVPVLLADADVRNSVTSINVTTPVNLETLRSLCDCPEVSSLSLDAWHTLEDHNFHLFCLSFPRLRSLSISGCTRITPRSVASVVQSCPHITRLGIGGCDRLTAAAVSQLCHSLEGLTSLDCSGAPIASASEIDLERKHFSELCLCNCRGVGDEFLRKLATSPSSSSLRHLDVSYTTASDAGIDAVAKHCTLLESLTISSVNASGRCVRAISSMQALRDLRTSGPVAEQIVAAVLREKQSEGKRPALFPALRSLELQGGKVGFAGIVALVTTLPALESLGIIGGDRLSGPEIAEIGALVRCVRGRHLDVTIFRC